MQIKGKYAVVVGGAQGIGHFYCNALLRKGARVYTGDVQEERGKAAVEEFHKKYGPESIYFCKVDVTKQKDVEEIFSRAQETFGQIDIAVGNAGIINEIDWEKCIDINLNGTIRVTYEAFKYMAKDKGFNGGTIIHTSSISGLRPEAWGPVYAATKHGVLAHCRSWALEQSYSKHGIRINCICPTAVKTGLQAQVPRSYHHEKHLKRLETVDYLPPEEIERALIELIENEKYNGTALRVTKAFGLDEAVFEKTPDQ